MNERIRELALESGFQYESYKDIWYLEGLNPSCDSEFQRFAELIVRECSKIITQGGYWNHALKGRTPASPSEIAKMVEDYFGIKK